MYQGVYNESERNGTGNDGKGAGSGCFMARKIATHLVSFDMGKVPNSG